MKIHPLWFIWLIISTIFSIAGAVVIFNVWFRFPFLPFFVAIINLIFIVYCFYEYWGGVGL